MGQILPLLIVIALVGAVSLWYRHFNGATRAADATFSPSQLRALGVPARRSSLLLFTAPNCASCANAKRVLDDLSNRFAIEVVVADVTEHAGIATAQHIYRAPTTFVVDERGRAVARSSGVPRNDELESVLTRIGRVPA